MVDTRIHIEIDMIVHLDRLGGKRQLELSICSCNIYRYVFINKLFYFKKCIACACPYMIIRKHDWCERYYDKMKE